MQYRVGSEVWLCVVCNKPADPDLFEYCVDCDKKFADEMRRKNEK